MVVLNGLIHAIMYTYYFVSMHTRDIWWKKYLTLAQLFQFTCMNGQALVLYATGCSDAPHGVVLRLHRLALRAVPPVLRRELRTQGEGGMNIHGGTVRYLVLTTLGRGGSFLNCEARRPG